MSDVARRWETVASAAARMKVSERHIRTLIQRGELPVVRLGRTLRIETAEVDRYMDEHRAEAV